MFPDASPTKIAVVAKRKRPRGGDVVNVREPVWEPLLEMARRIYLDDFMWMHEVELDNGVRLQVYKHSCTRRYLHLDGEGNAWFFRRDGRYEQLDGDIARHLDRARETRRRLPHQSVPSIELRQIVSESPADPGLLDDPADVRGAEVDDA